MDFLRGAAKAVWAAVAPIAVIVANDLADVIDAQMAGLVAAGVGALLAYLVPNRGPKANVTSG